MENKTINQVVRVGLSNNFNCTEGEFNQLNYFANKYPNTYFFINSNVNTPSLNTINDNPYKVVITANPNIRVSYKEYSKLFQINKEKISFIRVKYVPNNYKIKMLIKLLANKGYPVVVTNMRFNTKKNAMKYGIANYDYINTRYRLNKEQQNILCQFVDNIPNVYICDRKLLGCQSCNLCALLSAKTILPIKSVNLSSSGICPFNCIDCYAKTMQSLVIKWGRNPIEYDTIKQNFKQAKKGKKYLLTFTLNDCILLLTKGKQ